MIIQFFTRILDWIIEFNIEDIEEAIRLRENYFKLNGLDQDDNLMLHEDLFDNDFLQACRDNGYDCSTIMIFKDF